MSDQELAQFLSADPDTLPYFITEAGTERIVQVAFRALTPTDDVELRGESWGGAVFREVWLQYANDSRTLKLVCLYAGDTSIQGLMRLGQVLPGGGALRKSLLETAPSNRREAKPQRYRGVGRV